MIMPLAGTWRGRRGKRASDRCQWRGKIGVLVRPTHTVARCEPRFSCGQQPRKIAETAEPVVKHLAFSSVLDFPQRVSKLHQIGADLSTSVCKGFLIRDHSTIPLADPPRHPPDFLDDRSFSWRMNIVRKKWPLGLR